MEETKKCKFCQSDIPKKAKVCPNCKRNLSGGGCLLSIIVFIVVFVLISFGTIASSGILNDYTQKTVSGVSDDDEYITMEEYNKIETGMTYKEVKKIIGSSGEVTSTSGNDEYNITMYTWYGNGFAGSNANVTFENGVVSGKGQVGLK